MNDESYKVLQELETYHWFCQPCNVKMGKVIPNIVKLSERVTEIDGRVEKLEKELKVLCGRNTKLEAKQEAYDCLLYTSPSPRDRTRSRMPSSA